MSLKNVTKKEKNVVEIEFSIEKNVFDEAFFACHPCVNTATVRFSTDDLKSKVLPNLSHEYQIVDLECPEDEA